MNELNLTIVRNGKKLRGPFHLHLGLDEIFDFFEQAPNLSNADQHRTLVQRALKNGNGKCVYAETDATKMDKELGGATIIKLALQAQKDCGLDDLTSLSERVDAAEKKSKRGRK